MLLCHKETDNILIDKEKCNFFEKKSMRSYFARIQVYKECCCSESSLVEIDIGKVGRERSSGILHLFFVAGRVVVI